LLIKQIPELYPALLDNDYISNVDFIYPKIDTLRQESIDIYSESAIRVYASSIRDKINSLSTLKEKQQYAKEVQQELLSTFPWDKRGSDQLKDLFGIIDSYVIANPSFPELVRAAEQIQFD
jgi:hypothetical protein